MKSKLTGNEKLIITARSRGIIVMINALQMRIEEVGTKYNLSDADYDLLLDYAIRIKELAKEIKELAE